MIEYALMGYPTLLASLITYSLLSTSQAFTTAYVSFVPQPSVLATHQISLEDRQPDRYVNGVFKDNILLTIRYMEGNVSGTPIDWEQVRRPFSYQFKLNPGESFAFHDDVLDQYQGRVVKTTNAHFNASDGFKSDGYLMGDGVCHLASLMYWVAQDAHLDSYAPANHNFAVIPEINKEYGVAIYNLPGAHLTNAKQNLYITNNQGKPITFRFDFNGENLKLTVSEVI